MSSPEFPVREGSLLLYEDDDVTSRGIVTSVSDKVRVFWDHKCVELYHSRDTIQVWISNGRIKVEVL